jgi:hypothetical protein
MADEASAINILLSLRERGCKRKWEEDDDRFSESGECSLDDEDESSLADAPVKRARQGGEPAISMHALSTALLREPVEPGGAFVLLDANTGLATQANEFEMDCYRSALYSSRGAPAVVDAVKSALAKAVKSRADTLSDESLAVIAAAILNFNLLYNYYAGTWHIRLPVEIGGRFGEVQDPDGVYVRDVLLPGIVAGQLLVGIEFETEQHRALLWSASKRLKTSASLCRRVVRHLEWQMLWHTPPPPTITPAMPLVAESAYWAVAEWLVRVFGRRLVARRRDLPLCRPESYCSSPPALVSNMWSDFVASQQCDDGALTSKQQFALLVADWLGEWPRRHGWCRKAHFVGYQWRAEEQCWPKPPSADTIAALEVVDLAQRTRLMRERLPVTSTTADEALDTFRRHVQQHLGSHSGSHSSS